MAAVEEKPTGEDEIYGFLALLTATGMTMFVYLLIFMYIRSRERKFIFAADPEGPVATASSFFGWFAAVCLVTPADAKKVGGIDAWLFAARTRMHAKLGGALAFMSIPLALCYSHSGPTSKGFTRLTLTNVFAGTEESAYDWSWACIVGVWVTHVYFLAGLDALDEEAQEEMYRDLRQPRAQHYALIVTELEGVSEEEREESARLAVVSRLGRDNAILYIDVAPRYSSVILEEEEEEDTEVGDEEAGGAANTNDKNGNNNSNMAASTKMLASVGAGATSALLSTLKAADSVRDRVAAYEAALAAVAAADLAFKKAEAAGDSSLLPAAVSGWCKKGLIATETPEEKMVRVRAECNDARSKVLRTCHPGAIGEFADAAFVVVDKLSSACVASRVDRIAAPWVDPAPEPRDIVWPLLETLSTREVATHTENLGFMLKAAIFVQWTIVVVGVQLGIKIVLSVFERIGGPVATLIAVIAPIVNASVASFLLDYMAVILAQQFAPRFDSVWTKSRTAYVQQRDYTVFLFIVGFAGNLLGGAVFEAVQEISGQPFAIFSLLAESVPAASLFFINFVLYRTGTIFGQGTQVARWAVYFALKHLLPPVNDFAEVKALVPPDPEYGFATSWETFVLVCLLTYAPLAPVTAWICVIYFVFADFFGRMNVAAVAAANFTAAGKLWPLYVQQAMTAEQIALVVHVAIFLLSRNWWKLVVLGPLVAYSVLTRTKLRKRADRSLHGSELIGRLKIKDAFPIDEHPRAPAVARDIAHKAYADQIWSAPCAAKPDHADAVTDDPLPPRCDDVDEVNGRQFHLAKWLNRYDSAAFTKLPVGTHVAATGPPAPPQTTLEGKEDHD